MSEDEARRRLSADDVVNYPLKQAVRGYSVAQVDELLDAVADELERSAREIDELRSRLRRSEQRLQEASETEATLKRTLVTAQRAAEQSIEEAKERAAEILDEARRESAASLEQARLDAEELRVEALHTARAEEAEIRRRRQSLEAHIEALRVFERDYRSRLRGHLEDQLQRLDELDARPAPPAEEDVGPGESDHGPESDSDPGSAATGPGPEDETDEPRPPRAVAHEYDDDEVDAVTTGRRAHDGGPVAGGASVRQDT